MIRFLLPVALALSLSAPAFAHSVDCNNNTAPLEVKSGCCGSGDYRALQSNEVRVDGDGFDVFLNGKWRKAIHFETKTWLIAQSTGASCWGIWYHHGLRTGTGELWAGPQEPASQKGYGETDDYDFYCLEQPATF
jgi:hypothetical protein